MFSLYFCQLLAGLSLSPSLALSFWIFFWASLRVRKDYTVTKSHGAVEGDLGTPGSLSSQDSLICLCTPLLSHWRICPTQNRQKVKLKGREGWCVWVFFKKRETGWLGTTLIDRAVSWGSYSLDRKLSKKKEEILGIAYSILPGNLVVSHPEIKFIKTCPHIAPIVPESYQASLEGICTKLQSLYYHLFLYWFDILR